MRCRLTKIVDTNDMLVNRTSSFAFQKGHLNTGVPLLDEY